ncbi:MAG: hypothetical protein M1813_001798 [Trichoglossum hirsutum]|nr:MAG: hypothetical protein M1813_001798 [Trichoglossum hirsutum]
MFSHIDRYLASQPTLEVKFGEFTARNVRADGAPKMFFVCLHKKADGAIEPYVGASLADWNGLQAIKTIRREDRDLRLSAYEPLVTKAYEALYGAEQEAVPSTPLASGNEKVYRVRSWAIAKMRNSPHADFLGRKSETGQAFDKRFCVQQCCYACQGMMGYHVPADFSLERKKDYLCYFDWDKRHGNTLACAEIETSLQCSSDWQSRGESPKT